MEIEAIIKQMTILLDKMGVSFNEVVSHFIVWYVSSSLAWMVFAVLLCVGSVYGFKWLMRHSESETVDDYYEDIWKIWAIVVLVAGLIIGAIIFFSQIADLVGARGIAIHDLIIHLRG